MGEHFSTSGEAAAADHADPAARLALHRHEEVATANREGPAARRALVHLGEAAAADHVEPAARLALHCHEEVAATNREGPAARRAPIHLGEAAAADHEGLAARRGSRSLVSKRLPSPIARVQRRDARRSISDHVGLAARLALHRSVGDVAMARGPACRGRRHGAARAGDTVVDGPRRRCLPCWRCDVSGGAGPFVVMEQGLLAGVSQQRAQQQCPMCLLCSKTQQAKMVLVVFLVKRE